MTKTVPANRWIFRLLTALGVLFVPIDVSSQSELPGDILQRPILGNQRALFIRINYPDNNRVILSDQRAPEHASELGAIIETNSYGSLTCDIDITPVLTMPQPTSFYRLDDRKALVRIRADAVVLAEAAGYILDDYDREVIFTVRLWPQRAFLGIGGVNYRTVYTALDNAAHTAHEFGHTFDWRHANFWRVTSGNPIDTAGVLIEYGDKFDIMGDTRNFHHFNPWFKYRAGWLPAESVLTVSESGTHVIQALEKPPQSGSGISAYTALRIRRDPDAEYWVYYRSRVDSNNAGAMISRISPRNTSHALLLDMTPGSKAENQDHKDAALVPGRTIRDPEAGIEITVLERMEDSLRVRVIMSQRNIDRLPVLDFIRPVPGRTVSSAIEYEATAFDPDVANINGAGIDSVQFILGYLAGDDPWGEGLTFVVLDETVVTSPPYVFRTETAGLPDEAYRLQVGAASQNGGINTATFAHLVDNTGPSRTTSINEQQPNGARVFQLNQNYPNPFNPSTTISYSVKQSNRVELSIFTLLGKNIRSLVFESQPAGAYTVVWDGRDQFGKRMASGAYYYRLRVGNSSSMKKMLLLE